MNQIGDYCLFTKFTQKSSKSKKNNCYSLTYFVVTFVNFSTSHEDLKVVPMKYYKY